MNHIFLKISNRKILFIGTLLLLSTGLIYNSCLDERLKETEAFFEGYGDIYVQKKKVDGEIMYAPYYNLHGNSSIHSASVETPGGEIVELKPYEYLDTYMKEPGEEAFTTSMIEIGLYNFTGSYGDNNETFEINDSFYAGVINFPKIDSVGYDTTDYHIYVFWDAVNDADIYKVKLLNEAGRVVFDGPALTSASNTYAMDIETDGWTTTPYKGDVFTLQLHAFSLDEDANETNWFYNIECNSYSETQVVWGE
jgi:hypothetical protein